mmetsp:Transcript_6708/g.28126  ORF Transcript_6708/g.28126 Transcript_6708/m.28126 type:complete len:226 (+) Transcript_6708:263-940(+)
MQAPTPEAARMWPRSPSRPSEMSMAAVAMPRRAWPRASRGVGHSIAARTASNASPASATVPRKTSSASRASPRRPETQISSPTRAPLRNKARPGGASPNTVMQRLSGPCVVSPPTSGQPLASASASSPREKPANQASSARGRASASVKPRGVAPQAARSLRLTARALWPSRAGSTVDRKWRPSTSMSLDTSQRAPGVGTSTAQSSPTPTSMPTSTPATAPAATGR